VSDVRFATPQEAEEAFYRAFERGDLAAMADVWADDDAVVCVHPGGDRLRGRDEVLESWRQILGARMPRRFEIAGATHIQDAWLAIHCVFESISHGPRLEHQARVVVTNVYRLTEAGWRMIVHHASPAEAEETRTPLPAPDPPRRLH
jgi:uncharacterized protein (TIGR02246 family)